MSDLTTTKADPTTTLMPLVERFAQFYLGRSPRVSIRIAGEVIIVRLIDALTDAESRLVQADPTSAGRDAVEMLFRRLTRQAQSGFINAIQSVLGVTVRCLHVDLDSASGDGLIAVVLDKEIAM